MSDYRDIFRTPEHQNWFKCSLAVLIAREGLIDIVKDEIEKLHKDVLQKVIQANSIPEGTTCTCCSTLDALPCPTRGICQIRHGRCGFHTRPFRKCPNKVCDGVRKEIENEHRFNLPSWKNTDAKLWCSSPWELAKCFLPPDGYSNVKSADDADFNGLVSILINCKRFSNRFSDDLTKDTNVCTEAREVGRSVRHCAELKIGDSAMSRNIDALIQLLDDQKDLHADEKAKTAREKLKMLKNDSLAITTVNLKAVLDSVVDDTSDKIQQMMTQKLHEFKSHLHDIESDRSKTEEDHYTSLKHELRQELAKFYLERQSTMPLSPIIQEADDHLNKFYVTPKITQIKPSSADRNITTFKQIFRGDRGKKRSIYIQGEAGIGKSTFCTKLVLLWSEMLQKNASKDSCGADKSVHCDKQTYTKSERDSFTDNDILTEFDFLFFVALRGANRECDIETLIRNQVINELAKAKRYNDILEDILATEKCLIILDGLDEWIHPSNTACHKSEKVPHRKLWNNTTVVTTTRPWKINEIRLKDSEMDMLTEITGLTNASTFIRRVLQCLNDKNQKSLRVDEFMKVINSHSVSEFMDIPIVLLQMLCLWHEGHELGESKCEIYSNMSDMMLARAKEKFPSKADDDSRHVSQEMPRCFRNAHSCKRNKELLDSLGKLAFFTLHSSDKESRLSFSDSVVQDHIPSDHIVEKALNSGIISQHKLPSLTARTSTFCFLHKTFQEFLAAYFIATNTTASENVMTIIQQEYTNGWDSLNMSQLFPFVCGMSPKVAAETSDIMHEEENLMKFLFLDEQQMLINGYKEAVKNGYHDIRLSMRHVHYSSSVSHYDKTYLDQLVDTNKDKIVTCVIHALASSFSHRATSMFNMTSDAQSRKHKNPNFAMLPANKSKSRRPIQAKENASLDVPSSNTDIGNLSNTRSAIAWTLVSQVIPTLTSLRELHISDADLGDTDIPLPNSVQQLLLNNITITARACRQLVERISHVPHEVNCMLSRCTVIPKLGFEAIKKDIQKSDVFRITHSRPSANFYITKVSLT